MDNMVIATCTNMQELKFVSIEHLYVTNYISKTILVILIIMRLPSYDSSIQNLTHVTIKPTLDLIDL